MSLSATYTRPFASIGLGDVALVGGKNAALGELYRALRHAGVRVPNGFAITADAYRYTLDSADAWRQLHLVFEGLVADDLTDLATRAAKAREIVEACPLPSAVEAEVRAGYDALVAEYGTGLTVAVRSSATAEDAPTASFAGQQETYLNIGGADVLVGAVRRCFASLFTDRSIHYRLDQGFSLLGVTMSVGVQKMVRSDLATSGIMFTLDPETGFRDVVVVSACYGFGENIVQGAIVPDDFTVFKPTFRAGHRAVLRRSLGSKRLKMVVADPPQTGPNAVQTVNVETPTEDQQRFCIDDDDVATLAGYAIAIEDHWSASAGHPVPMDIEWAKDGTDGSLWIVQARPETVASQRQANLVQTFHLTEGGELITTGRSVGTRIGSGTARVIPSTAEIGSFRAGEVLVTDATTPDWEPVMKLAAAIVTNRGGRTCHAAIVARELGIPAVVGCGDATETIANGQAVTVSCGEGEVGNVYRGLLDFEVATVDTSCLPETATKIMLIVGNPDTAFAHAALPNDGVGLCRMEFVITESIRAHPMALAHPERLSPADKAAITELTRGYPSPAAFFVERLAEGVGTIAAAFFPKPVIVRLSDFKTNEYAKLMGGAPFEPTEANPMLGFRGASRYTHPAYADGFALECAALRRARETLGLTNIMVMIPFCRRVEEARAVTERLAAEGLRRGEGGLELYLMCEIPNNVISIDAFSAYVDGFSIGSNDLTQLVLGVDRDSELVAADFDERDPGVMAFIGQAVAGCRRNGKHSGICGQAPSDYPEVAAALVEMGIDSISLNPDAVVTATRAIAALEAGTNQRPATVVAPSGAGAP